MTTVVLLFTLAASDPAQVPAGTIAGVVCNQSTAAIAGGRVQALNLATGLLRITTTSQGGDYSLTVLPPGEYAVSVEISGFRRMTRAAVVEPGGTTTVHFTLSVGDVAESLTVDGASPQIRYDSYAIGGVVTRRQIQDLPLNGRSFLELAKLEPGVQPPSRASSNRTFVPVLGAPLGNNGRGTRVTIDGGSIMAVGNGGSAMGFSQEGVQEFQISTVNFDLSTGPTFSGAVNSVTRQGSNRLQGTAFYFFRDHRLAAYPALNRDPANPDPFFQRRQAGLALGGPIRRDRLFVFGNWERNDQQGAVATTLSGDFRHLSRVTTSPLVGNQASVRLDARLSVAHAAFVRYSHDGNRAVGPSASQPNAYPSSWTRQSAGADQTVLGLTSVLRPTLVNDLRVSYFFVSSNQLAPLEEDCPGCLGIGAPAIRIQQSDLIIGGSDAQRTLGRRFQLTDSMTWQRSAHRVRLGVDWEYNRGGVLNWTNDPVTMTLYSPEEVRDYNARPQTPEDLRIPLPVGFNTLSDLLQLPLQSFTVGIGDPRVLQENGGTTRRWHTLRVFVHDSWRLRRNVTLSSGLGWSVDRNQNYDLSKPPLLAPILGADGLAPTRKQWTDLSPAFGLTWVPTKDAHTVIRGGAGVFYDFLFPGYLDAERALLGPLGLGRVNIRGGAIANTSSGIPGVPVGRLLAFRSGPTMFSGAELMTMLPDIRARQSQTLADSDPSIRAIQITKQGTLNPVTVRSPRALHVNLGIQRELAHGFVLNADVVYRHFVHLGRTPDQNHFNSIRGPVIPVCTTAQRDDPQALCSNEAINVHESAGYATYRGLLIRADRRFSHGSQILASYAWSSNTGTNDGNGFDLDNRQSNVGPRPTDYTHIANLAGVVQLPLRVQLGLNFSYASAPPFSAYVGGIDFNGDGTTGDLLPGTSVGAFNRGLGAADLVRLVEQFNRTHASTADPHGTVIPRLELPASYSFGRAFQSLDLRLSWSLMVREHRRLQLIGEVFNAYNAANLTGHSGDLTGPAFGQPTSRVTQVFGSGGPRAGQLAVRLSF